MTSHFRNQFSVDIEKLQLKSARAKRMAHVVDSDDLDGVEYVGCLLDSDQGLEAIVVNVSVPLGQKDTVNDIKSVEPIAITFGGDDRLPFAYPLREDFPFHLPHVNVALKRHPRSLCLSDQSVELQIRDYTAMKMLYRVQLWLERSAYGELHGDEQPLDPMFFGSQIQIIAKTDVLSANHVVGARTSDQSNAPVALQSASLQELESVDKNLGFYNFIAIDTASVPHGQLNWVPTDLLQLLEVYRESAADIFEQLAGKLKDIASLGSSQHLLDFPIVLLLATKIVASNNRSFLQLKAYLSLKSAGEMGASLGLFERAAGVGWGQIIGGSPPDESLMGGIEMLGADINFPLTRDQAAEYSNLATKVDHKLTMIGAGAVGSHFLLAVARGGAGEWHIIDDDFLLPHNLARHALDPHYLGFAKSEACAKAIQSLFHGEEAAKAYVHRMSGDVFPEEVALAFKGANEIIDASASVSVAQQLAFASDIRCPVTSIFLTPTGDDGVMLSEDIKRSTKLDCIEAHYYWMVSTNSKLEQHLNKPGKSIPIGGCRTPSARIPETQVGLLSSVMGGRWVNSRQSCFAMVRVWRGSSSFESIDYIEETVPEFVVVQVGDWKINISTQVLESITALKLKVSPKETGGIVIGSWDKVRKIGYIVGVFDAPPDSKHSETSFVRGSVGVHKTIHEVETETLGGLTYIGEWHSHPPGASSNPSPDDRLLLSWIGEHVEPFEAPAIMIISADEGLRLLCQSGVEVSEALMPSGASCGQEHEEIN